MISGSVRNREAIIELEVSAPGQPPRQYTAVVDTGYNGYLTLPRQAIAELQMPFAGHRRAARRRNDHSIGGVSGNSGLARATT